MIIRPDYINEIIPFMDAPIVKILAGVRRCGKSTILSMLAEEFEKRGIDKQFIIERQYNEVDIQDGFSNKDMFNDIKAQIKGKERYYLLLDELQEIDGWEKTVNTLLEKYNVDIYVTGSNSKLMSSEISTYLTGRYVLIPVYTLSLREYIAFKGKSVNDSRTVFDEYVQYGGFPVIGISNFEDNKFEEIYNAAKIKPVLNQIELHPYFQQKNIRERMDKVNVKTEGWGPLAEAKTYLFNEDVIQKAAVKYKKTPAQIILRWHIQSGFITIPKSQNPRRIKENFEIFDFKLTDEEMKGINDLDGKKGRIQYNSFILKTAFWLMPKPKD